MMNLSKRTAFLLLTVTGISLLSVTDTFAQKKKKKKKKEKTEQLQPWEVDTLVKPIPINRQRFTDNVAKQVRSADLRDGSVDGTIELEDKATSQVLTQSLLHEVPLIEIHIENLTGTGLADQTKIRYHRALDNLMKRLNAKTFTVNNATYVKRSVRNFEEIIIAIEENRIMDFVKENANIYTLDNSELLDNYPEAKGYVFEAIGKENPEMMIKRLKEFAREPYADPIVAAAAKVVPGTILTYATSTSVLSSVVRRNKDPLVQTIVRIASESRTPLKVLPFLGDIYNKRKTVAQIDAIANNPAAYYQNLVRLKTEGESIADKTIDQEINYRGLQFVREVNRLHDAPNATRFKSLLNFNAEDLYFMMIASQDEIYTSSFTWMFDRMLEKMKPKTGDELLEKVKKSHFRTFIRMAAGYNTLSSFLATMEENKKMALMKEFVSNLDKGAEDELEDAVDVADAFGSITDPKLAAFLKDEVISNYERKDQSKKGIVVYGLLSTIFKGAENSETLSGDLNDLIPPITYVPYESLKNDKGQVVVQTFFYGDEDGKTSFTSFKSNFPASKWKSVANKQWVTYTSTGAHPIVVYANLPLTEPKDEEAQNALANYMDEKNIVPTMVIHRGHSYHLGGSLERLTPDVKVVMLGSCGGYHNLATVLDKSPDANIISTKQVGSYTVNEPIIRSMFDQLLEGRNIDWISSWSDLNRYFSSKGSHEKDLFSDYIPPNKNLGAIFIKAYRKQLQNLDEE
jgi:hypothetical protein